MGTLFDIDSEAVNPADVPVKILPDGSRMPALGLGTFGSDHASADQVAVSVRDAISLGYRHIDCASVYGNEAEIGRVFQDVFHSGLVKRKDMWITSKLWNDRHGSGDVLLSLAQTLKDLKLDYLDLFLVHWPFPNFHPPGCSVNSRSLDAKPYIHHNFMKTWQQMERLVDAGLVRHIGTSNMSIPKLELLLNDARIKPAANEMEMHPHFQQKELFEFVQKQKMIPIAFCPIGSPGRPERDRTPDDTVDIDDPVIVKIAEKHGVHPVLVCLKWALQRGAVPIPFSTKRRNYLANLNCSTEDPLTDGEMDEIAAIDKNCRLIKGQVFLWKDNQSWEDLWDIDGTIVQ